MNTPTPTITLSPEHDEWLKATFARNHAQFGGFSMELDDSGDESPKDEPSGDEPAADEPSGDEPSGDEPTGDEDDEDESTQLDEAAAKAALAKVRKSEAKMRTRLRDIEAKLAEAKTPEQIEELLAGVRKETADEARSLMVENVALKNNVPEALWDRLKGDTREELEADAKALAALLPSEPSEDPDLSGGLDPSSKPDATHKELADIMRGQRRRR